MQNLYLPCTLIAIPNAAPEQGTQNLDGGKSQSMHVNCTENCHPATAIMATMWKYNVTSDTFSLPTRSRMCK